MPHNQKPAACKRKPSEFADRAQLNKNTAQGLANLKRDNTAADASVRALLTAAVKVGAAQ